jgi:hypothetical protein
VKTAAGPPPRTFAHGGDASTLSFGRGAAAAAPQLAQGRFEW